MGIRDRLKFLVPLLMAMLMTAESSAQQIAAFPTAGPPAYSAGPAYSNTAHQGMPQSFQSHPMISPFDNALEQHFTSDGLWFRRFLSGMGPRNTYHFNVDFIHTKTRDPKGYIGHPTAPTFIQEGADDIGFVDATLPDALFFEPFPAFHANALPSSDMFGIRIRGGVENRQGWGFKWNVTYNGDSNEGIDLASERLKCQLHFFDAIMLEESGGVANGQFPNNLSGYDERVILENDILGQRIFDVTNIEQFGVSGETFDILDRNIYPYASLPIQNNNPDDPYGIPMLFDVYYEMERNVQSWGSGAHLSFAPLLEKDSLRVRAVAGGRYYHIDESWGFRGGNSGLAYTFSQPDGLDSDDDFWVDNVAEEGALDFVALIPDGSQQILVRSFTRSQVKSSLGGPEIGLEYDVGEKGGIQVTGHTKVGAMFNSERAFLEGDNIGHQYRTELDLITGSVVRSEMFDTTTLGGVRTQNYFTDTKRTTHISPMFEQSLNADIPIFAHVPVLKNWWQLEHAKLRLGWNFLWLGEIMDPSASIEWTANPRAGIFPYLKTKRSSFFQNTFSAGINWDF